MLSADTCAGQDVLCAPGKLTDSAYVPPTCASIAGAEGRCLAACIPDVAAQADRLPQDICDAGELCAPCYDPITGDATGACDLNGDAPTQPPLVFEKCCNESGTTHGTCVPATVLSASQVSSLPVDTCPDDTWRCAPDAKVLDPNASLPACSYGVAALQCYPAIFNLGCEGVCLNACFIGDQASLLAAQQCTTGLCAPCTDPLSGDPTGACE